MTEVFGVLFAAEIFQRIRPQEIAHGTESWRLFESIQLQEQRSNRKMWEFVSTPWQRRKELNTVRDKHTPFKNMNRTRFLVRYYKRNSDYRNHAFSSSSLARPVKSIVTPPSSINRVIFTRKYPFVTKVFSRSISSRFLLNCLNTICSVRWATATRTRLSS